MNTKKKLMKREVIMQPIPRFEKMVIGIKPKARTNELYILEPIEASLIPVIRDRLDPHSENYDELGSIVVVNGTPVNSKKILLFGDPNDNSDQAIRILENSITYTGVLCIPTPINLDTMMMGDSIVPGVSIERAFKYYCALIGNPDNVIIYTHVKHRKN